MRNRREARRAYLKALLGGKCAKCPATTDLQFDHIDPKTKSFTVGSRLDGPMEKYEEELKKCQLLCRKCHIEKSRQEARRSVCKRGHARVGNTSKKRACATCTAEYRKRKKNEAD